MYTHSSSSYALYFDHEKATALYLYKIKRRKKIKSNSTRLLNGGACEYLIEHTHTDQFRTIINGTHTYCTHTVYHIVEHIQSLY